MPAQPASVRFAAILLAAAMGSSGCCSAADASGFGLGTACRVLRSAVLAGDPLVLSEAFRMGRSWLLANDTRRVFRTEEQLNFWAQNAVLGCTAQGAQGNIRDALLRWYNTWAPSVGYYQQKAEQNAAKQQEDAERLHEKIMKQVLPP